MKADEIRRIHYPEHLAGNEPATANEFLAAMLQEIAAQLAEHQCEKLAMAAQEMKTQEEIEAFKDRIDTYKRRYSGMSYEQGLEAALAWVLGEIEDEKDIYDRKD